MTETRQEELFLQAGLTPCTQARLSSAEGKPEESWGQWAAEERAGEVDKLQLVVIKKTWCGETIMAIRCKMTLQHRKRKRRLPWAGSTSFTFQQGKFGSDRRMRCRLGRLQGRGGTSEQG